MPEGFTVWITGMSGAGKSTCARQLEARLRGQGRAVEVLDGDLVRQHLSKGLGFTREDRDENVRRIGFVAELLTRNGVAVIVAAISPYRTARDEVRQRIPRFLEVHMCCPLEVLERRDTKGLYKRALAGEIRNFTGVSAPYELPLSAEVTIDSSRESEAEGAQKVWATLAERGWI